MDVAYLAHHRNELGDPAVSGHHEPISVLRRLRSQAIDMRTTVWQLSSLIDAATDFIDARLLPEYLPAQAPMSAARTQADQAAYAVQQAATIAEGQTAQVRAQWRGQVPQLGLPTVLREIELDQRYGLRRTQQEFAISAVDDVYEHVFALTRLVADLERLHQRLVSEDAAES